MAEEKSLDLSQVSVANLLNNDAPTDIPAPEPEAAVEEQEQPEAPANEEVEDVPQAEVAESEDTAPEATEAEETSEPVSSTEEETEEPGVIDILRGKLGYEIEGTFSEDYEGVAKFTDAVANEMAKEQLDSVFAQFPDVEQYLQYRYNGGDPKQYFQATAPVIDYSAVEITDDNVAIQRAVLEDFLGRSGYTGEEVAETIQDYIDAGILQRQASRSLGKLQKMQEQEAATLIEKQKQEATARQEKVQQQWTSIQETINQGSVKGFDIPTADRKKFFSWMSDAVDNQGRTQRLIDREKMDLESQVAMEYLLWKNFDLNKLVSNTQNTRKAQNLKQKLQQSKPASQRMKGGRNSASKAPAKLPSLKDLL